MPHPLRCPNCRVILGVISRKHDHRGRPYDRLKLNQNAQHVGRVLFRGKYAECVCGERVRLPDGVTVEFH